ncbi:MAG: hypothetical protein FJX56_09515 [Alphaproteobacteria bacterium]|nr:hypothetical protein [Alphaproteobacteria bacterium]
MIAVVQRGLLWTDAKVPPGLRSVVGLLLIVGGFLGFLPVLGFWMLPLGILVVGLDIPPLRRRLLRWSDGAPRNEKPYAP